VSTAASKSSSKTAAAGKPRAQAAKKADKGAGKDAKSEAAGARDAAPVDLGLSLATAAEQLATKGRAAIAGVGRFSVRASRGRKGVRRRVVLRVDPSFQEALDRDGAPPGGTAQALLEALGDGKTLRIAGLGEFAVTHHDATSGVHPRTRMRIAIPARRTLTLNGATLKT